MRRIANSSSRGQGADDPRRDDVAGLVGPQLRLHLQLGQGGVRQAVEHLADVAPAQAVVDGQADGDDVEQGVGQALAHRLEARLQARRSGTRAPGGRTPPQGSGPVLGQPQQASGTESPLRIASRSWAMASARSVLEGARRRSWRCT